MRVFIIFLCVLFCAGPPVQARESYSALFIGNRLLTQTPTMDMLAGMIEQNGKAIDFTMHIPPGSGFMDHARRKSLHALIQSKAWDFVILQGHSQETSWPDWQVDRDVRPYAAALVRDIRANHKETTIIFLMTMARKNGDPLNMHIVPEVATYDGMQRRIIRTYTELANENNVMLASVGSVWQSVRKEHPHIELYRDNVYANDNGGYLTACTLYTSVFCAPCKSDAQAVPISPDYADIIVEEVSDIVLGRCLSS